VNFPEGAGQEDLQEFTELVCSAGAVPVATVTATRNSPRGHGCSSGQGKAEEIRIAVETHNASVVIFNHSLSPSQERNLERQLSCRVLARTGLILDIFAQRARSFEGKLQVELAQLRHLSTRLIRGWTHLERQKGGIGLRGPGETQLESDRRMINARIKMINRRLEKVERQRDQGRRARQRAEVPTVSLVGYTNAGKSTLFNRLTHADVLVEDRLFATLGSTVRRLDLPDGHRALMSDTVGFVRRLPHELVEAFRSTLDEAADADLLVHVVDASDPDPDGQIAAVREVLAEIEATGIPEILVFNKIDIAEPAVVGRLLTVFAGSVAASALTGDHMEEVAAAIVEGLDAATVTVDLLIPYERGDLVASLHDTGEVLDEHHVAAGTRISARLPAATAETLAAYRRDPME